MKPKRNCLLFLKVLLIGSGFLFAQTTSEKLQNLFETCYQNGQFNGNVLIAEKGKIIYHKSFGLAQTDPQRDLTLTSQFRLASVSKQFTAMTIMILKERGILAFEDDIRKHIPELPYEGITVHHLLTHTGGLPDYMGLFNQHWDIDRDANDPDKKIAANADVVRLMAQHKPAILFKPGEKWQYSNTGYVLLAVISERASGMPFETFMKKSIFEPLNMDRSLVYSAIRDDKMEERVYGFRLGLDGETYLSNDHHFLNGIAGDGAVFSTTEDLLKWDRALYSDKIVSDKTRQQAFTRHTLNDGSEHHYGYGWGVDTTLSGGKLVGHSGGWVGFSTWLGRHIEDDRTVILLNNNSNSHLGDIRKSVNNILYNEPYRLPKISIAATIAKTLLKEGDAAAVQQYKKLKAKSSDTYNFAEQELNFLGYQLMWDKKLDQAISIFKLNVEMFPESANPYDSLAEAYMKAGKTALAIQFYEKTLELNPANDNAVKLLKKLKKELDGAE